VKTYIDLLKMPGVARVVLSQLTARFPFGMLSLAFLIHIEHIHNSYAAAGAVLGSLALGQALVGPITSRMMGIFGIRPVIISTIVVVCATVSVMALLPLPIWALMVLGLVAGASMPPIQPAVRTMYPKMVPSTKLTPLFSLDASAQEIIWILGPVITTFIAVQISSVTAILVSVAFFVFGGLWFLTSPVVGRVRIPRSKTRFGGVLKRPTVIISTVVGLLLVASFAAVEAGVVAVFGNGGPTAGWVLGIFALGSLFGGLAIGHREISSWSLTIRMFVVAAGMIVAIFSTDFWWLSITLFISGIGVAPALTVLFANVSATLKFSETAEAYAWIGSGQLIGVGVGSAIGGLSIDAFGPSAAIVVAALFAGAGTIAALISKPWSPDLRNRDLSPIPDTEPIPIQY
jgi:MFS family permease